MQWKTTIKLRTRCSLVFSHQIDFFLTTLKHARNISGVHSFRALEVQAIIYCVHYNKTNQHLKIADINFFKKNCPYLLNPLQKYTFHTG